MNEYLLWYKWHNDFYYFIQGELYAILEIFGLDVKQLNIQRISDVYYSITLQDDLIATQIMHRSVFLRGVVKVFSNKFSYGLAAIHTLNYWKSCARKSGKLINQLVVKVYH